MSHDQKNTSPIAIFYAYAPEDKALLRQLEVHMSTLRQKGKIVDWSDQKLRPGMERDQIIEQKLRSAQLICLLISPNFLKSDQCRYEMHEALKLRDSHATIVCPLLLRPVDWENAPFAHLQCLPLNRQPIVLWKNRDQAFQTIVEEIRHTIERLQPTRADNSSTPLTSIVTDPTITTADQQETTSHRVKRLLYAYTLHADTPMTVAWSPDGTRIASGGVDQTAHVWQADNGKHLLIYREHLHVLPPSAVWTVRWSPDGMRIASGGLGTNVHIWDATNGQNTAIYTGHGLVLKAVVAANWSPDGTLIASTSMSLIDEAVHIWNATNGHTVDKIDFHKVLKWSIPQSVAWSPDGTRIAAAWNKFAQITEVQSKKRLNLYKEHTKSIVKLTWSPDNTAIATADNREVHIWNAVTGATLSRYIAHKDNIRDLSWSPNGRYLATASNDRTVHIWEALTGKLTYIYTGHHNLVTAVTWSPDGTRIASASADKTIHVWQTMLDA